MTRTGSMPLSTHIFGLYRWCPVTRRGLAIRRVSTRTTLPRPQPFGGRQLFHHRGGSHCLSVTATARFSMMSMAARNEAPLVWIDCEMTGLDHNNDQIIEIYCLITDGNLKLVDSEGWGTVIHQTQERMGQMDDWCTHTHAETGLTAAVVASEVTAEQAADGLLAYIQKYVPEPRKALLAGNSVHADRAFLNQEPYRKVVDYLHYRILDVSSLKEAARRWCPQVMEKAPLKKTLHKAKDDILESIEEARFYKTAIFERN